MERDRVLTEGGVVLVWLCYYSTNTMKFNIIEGAQEFLPDGTLLKSTRESGSVRPDEKAVGAEGVVSVDVRSVNEAIEEIMRGKGVDKPMVHLANRLGWAEGSRVIDYVFPGGYKPEVEFLSQYGLYRTCEGSDFILYPTDASFIAGEEGVLVHHRYAAGCGEIKISGETFSGDRFAGEGHLPRGTVLDLAMTGDCTDWSEVDESRLGIYAFVQRLRNCTGLDLDSVHVYFGGFDGPNLQRFSTGDSKYGWSNLSRYLLLTSFGGGVVHDFADTEYGVDLAQLSLQQFKRALEGIGDSAYSRILDRTVFDGRSYGDLVGDQNERVGFSTTLDRRIDPVHGHLFRHDVATVVGAFSS